MSGRARVAIQPDLSDSKAGAPKPNPPSRSNHSYGVSEIYNTLYSKTDYVKFQKKKVQISVHIKRNKK